MPYSELSEGLCVGMDTETWYSDDEDTQEVAKGICRRCPVREACLLSAMREEAESGFYQAWGIRGGKTADKRQPALDIMRLRKDTRYSFELHGRIK